MTTNEQPSPELGPPEDLIDVVRQASEAGAVVEVDIREGEIPTATLHVVGPPRERADEQALTVMGREEKQPKVTKTDSGHQQYKGADSQGNQGTVVVKPGKPVEVRISLPRS